jgi:hypothetical protein
LRKTGTSANDICLREAGLSRIYRSVYPPCWQAGCIEKENVPLRYNYNKRKKKKKENCNIPSGDTKTNISEQGRAGFWNLDHSKPEQRKMHLDYFFVYVENIDLNSVKRKYNYKIHEGKQI